MVSEFSLLCVKFLPVIHRFEIISGIEPVNKFEEPYEINFGSRYETVLFEIGVQTKLQGSI